MNSPEREEVARIAKSFGFWIDEHDDWWDDEDMLIPKPAANALISREMRVRELEAEIQSLHDWQLGLNSKGEKGWDMEYGIYDTQDECWIGDSAGPILFQDFAMARIAAQVYEDQLFGNDLGGRLKAQEHGGGPQHNCGTR